MHAVAATPSLNELEGQQSIRKCGYRTDQLLGRGQACVLTTLYRRPHIDYADVRVATGFWNYAAEDQTQIHSE